MNFDEMHAAVKDAERTLSLADGVITKIARMLIGRLRKVESGWVLADLKRELRGFNIHTKKWD